MIKFFYIRTHFDRTRTTGALKKIRCRKKILKNIGRQTLNIWESF